MRKILFTAAALTLAISAGAQAQSLSGQDYVATFSNGNLLPTNGSNGPVQTANSLPSPAEIKGGWISPEAYAAARGYEQDNGHAFAARGVTTPAS